MWRFAAIGAGVLLSMAFLVFVAMRGDGGFVYYMTVSEFLEAEQAETQGFRVNGKVVDGTIDRKPSGLDVQFVMSDGSSTMPVVYHGIVPDTFVDGADVVVEGRLDEQSVFQAHHMLAKCPSKYEAADDADPARTLEPPKPVDVSQRVP